MSLVSRNVRIQTGIKGYGNSDGSLTDFEETAKARGKNSDRREGTKSFVWQLSLSFPFHFATGVPKAFRSTQPDNEDLIPSANCPGYSLPWLSVHVKMEDANTRS